MSNSEQTYGTIAGAVIGLVVTGGNPYGAVQGAYWGYAISSIVFPETGGDRVIPGLQDKRVSSGDYGFNIPIGYGSGKVVGWLMEGREIYEREVKWPQSKGLFGKRTYTITYDAYFTGAFLLCEGPIAGVSRVWADGKLIFDFGVSAEAEAHFIGTPQLSGAGGFRAGVTLPFDGGGFRFYLGTEDQLPDEELESLFGVGNVPAYRGIAYVVIEDFLLNGYGKRIPNFTFEVAFAGQDVNTYDSVAYSGAVLDPAAQHYSGSTPIFYSRTNNTVTIVRSVYTGSTWTGYVLRTYDAITRTLKWSKDFAGNPYIYAPVAFDEENDLIWLGYLQAPNVKAISLSTGELVRETTLPIVPTFAFTMALCRPMGRIWYAVDFNIVVFSAFQLRSTSWYPTPQVIDTYPIPYRTQRIQEVPHRKWMLVFFNMSGPFNQIRVLSELGIFVTDITMPSPAESSGMGECVVSEYHDALFIYVSGSYYKVSLADFSISLVYTLSFFTFGGSNSELITNESDGSFLQAQFRRTSTTSNEVLLFDRDFNLVATYDLPGTTFQLFYAVLVPSVGELWGDGLRTAFTLFFCKLGRISSAASLCGDIAINLASRAGVPGADLSLLGLTASVDGYVVDRRMPAKNAIDPLRIVGLFDLVIEDGGIRAKVRGGNSVMTVFYDDLVLQPDGIRPYEITHLDASKTASIIDLVYNDKDRNFERSIARDQRTTVGGSEISTVVLPVAISPSQARQVAQSLLYSAWAGKDVWKIHGSRKHLRLSPGDAFDFVDESAVTRRLLCTGKSVTGFNVVDIDAIQDEQSAWTSTALGASGAVIAVPSYTPAPSVIFLDIPIIREQDDFQGIYIGANYGQANVSLYLSEDGGITFEFATLLTGMTAGNGVGYSSQFNSWIGGNVFDDGNYFDVKLSGGTLASVTDAQLLVAGKNICVFGVELVQFGTATLLSSANGQNTYRLTHLLRGRKGTEFAISTHSTGDKFVLLDPIPARYALSGVGQNLIWKLVANADDLESQTKYTSFVCEQIGHRPYSPVYITGARDGSSNLTIGFTRRARYGSAWGASLTVPLDQDTESYEIDIMSGVTVKRTISTTTPSATYSAADQVTDFGSAQASVLVNIYQLSSVFGRGTPGIATI